MAVKKSKGRILVRMNSSEGTGSYYTTTVNPRNTTEKLKIKKYDRKLRRHVIFVQDKIKG
jgi:large subunit ribosomal protein L33